MSAFTDGLQLYGHVLSFTDNYRGLTGFLTGFTDTECSRFPRCLSC